MNRCSRIEYADRLRAKGDCVGKYSGPEQLVAPAEDDDNPTMLCEASDRNRVCRKRIDVRVCMWRDQHGGVEREIGNADRRRIDRVRLDSKLDDARFELVVTTGPHD